MKECKICPAGYYSPEFALVDSVSYVHSSCKRFFNSFYFLSLSTFLSFSLPTICFFSIAAFTSCPVGKFSEKEVESVKCPKCPSGFYQDAVFLVLVFTSLHV